ncbi:hypothetical protein BJ165DRAFT_1419314 [Panaeolus papilionaceus]|nr:hypothetical protein BJ165DRAFT_1419314 [Panaeolus papilionaceus]
MGDTADFWRNWPRHRAKILALFCEKGISSGIDHTGATAPPSVDDLSDLTFARGAWYSSGASEYMTVFPYEVGYFTKMQATATLIFLECLPSSVFDQIFDCNTAIVRWRRLHELYEENQQALRADAVPSPVDTLEVPPIISSIQLERPAPISDKANSFLLDSLRRYPKYGERQQGSTTQPSIVEHLTYMQVLYEGLVLRNANITGEEFISVVHENLSRLPMFQAFVMFLNNQAKTQGRANVAIPELIDGVAGYEAAFGQDKVELLLRA